MGKSVGLVTDVATERGEGRGEGVELEVIPVGVVAGSRSIAEAITSLRRTSLLKTHWFRVLDPISQLDRLPSR